MLWSHGAGLDHPVHPAIPETDYLKATLAGGPPGTGWGLLGVDEYCVTAQ